MSNGPFMPKWSASIRSWLHLTISLEAPGRAFLWEYSQECQARRRRSTLKRMEAVGAVPGNAKPAQSQPSLLSDKPRRATLHADTRKTKPDRSAIARQRNYAMKPFASAAAAFASLIFAWSSVAAELQVVKVWPGKVPKESGNIGAERLRMSPALDRKQVEVTEPTQMITDVTKPTITIYRPAKEKETGTAMLICPGGGCWNLYWQLEGEEVATWLNSIGVTGIILKYRVPRRPDEPQGEPARRPLADAQRAVSLVRSRAEEWGIHPARIGIVGFSAGGHLAIATATSFEKRT